MLSLLLLYLVFVFIPVLRFVTAYLFYKDTVNSSYHDYRLVSYVNGCGRISYASIPDSYQNYDFRINGKNSGSLDVRF